MKCTDCHAGLGEIPHPERQYKDLPQFRASFREACKSCHFDNYTQSLDGIFFWMRVLFGLAGPSVLAYLTWETAKIQSTQSATGILYVDLFTVVVGELLAKAVLLATRVPV